MRTQLSFYTLLLLLAASCNKKDEVQAPAAPNPLPAPVQAVEEYFWAQPWQKTARGYEIGLASNRLTQEAIARGIDVAVAIDTEMTLFVRLPNVINWIGPVELSYKAEPGKLYVITPSLPVADVQSDVRIRYK